VGLAVDSWDPTEWQTAAVRTLQTTGAVLGFVATVASVVGLAWRAWVRTIGRRRRMRRRLEQLSTNVQIGFVTSLIGEPAMKRTEGGRTEWVWADPLFYVQAVTDTNDDRVLRFAVTSRSLSFRPQFTSAGRNVELHRTSFDQFDAKPSAARRPSIGAHSFAYDEEHWFGNPGLYQRIWVAVAQAGAVRTFGPMTAASDSPDDAVFDRFRREVCPNTYGESAPLVDEVDPFSIGVDEFAVRVIRRPPARSLSDRWVQRRLQRNGTSLR
jgi:hypothetical protein